MGYKGYSPAEALLKKSRVLAELTVGTSMALFRNLDEFRREDIINYPSATGDTLATSGVMSQHINHLNKKADTFS